MYLESKQAMFSINLKLIAPSVLYSMVVHLKLISPSVLCSTVVQYRLVQIVVHLTLLHLPYCVQLWYRSPQLLRLRCSHRSLNDDTSLKVDTVAV